MNWLNDVLDRCQSLFFLGLNTFLPCRSLRENWILILDV